ncbi:hypothetical protein [Actinoallomurus sp. CA-142502]|uniref:hypothetical protein n=1 Tax=Actinoallomurus sp. CA-142502 TaxID=3239885 RepID=UPI003D8EC4BC
MRCRHAQRTHLIDIRENLIARIELACSIPIELEAAHRATKRRSGLWNATRRCAGGGKDSIDTGQAALTPSGRVAAHRTTAFPA